MSQNEFTSRSRDQLVQQVPPPAPKRYTMSDAFAFYFACSGTPLIVLGGTAFHPILRQFLPGLGESVPFSLILIGIAIGAVLGLLLALIMTRIWGQKWIEKVEKRDADKRNNRAFPS